MESYSQSRHFANSYLETDLWINQHVQLHLHICAEDTCMSYTPLKTDIQRSIREIADNNSGVNYLLPEAEAILRVCKYVMLITILLGVKTFDTQQ